MANARLMGSSSIASPFKLKRVLHSLKDQVRIEAAVEVTYT